MHGAIGLLLLAQIVLMMRSAPEWPKPDPVWEASCADDVVAHMAESTDHNPVCDKRKL